MLMEYALRAALAQSARGEVTFARDFQGFPETVHGGAVAALFYRVTTPRPPVHLRVELRRGTPTETALRLTTGSQGGRARLTLAHGDRLVADAELTREAVPTLDPTPTLAAWRGAHAVTADVPGTPTCLACGSANPLGLAVRFHVAEQFLWREYTPPESYRAADGSLHAALVCIMLDELGWWLGAVGQRECGVTTEVALSVYRPLPFAPLLVIGERAPVGTDDDARGRYTRARGWLFTATGVLLAAAEVRFAGSRAYTKRLVGPFLESTEAEELFRFFPNARALVQPRPEPGPRPR
jgi:hypothetical protein